MKVLSSEPASLARVKDILKARKKVGDLGYEQEAVFEHLEVFLKHSTKESEKLLKDVLKINEIPLETAIKIVDLTPKTPDTLKAIMLKDNVELSDEEISAIVKLFK